ncbi:Protein kinase domain [Carpediemonas membranifera]|uniref:Protein kinase domain n=1 Tax=Carpediemonas membranifera TaxID=201153 RepID=A0A8J6E0H5_9EUKA|nr:Protein kinase domain [Carpediemonas membranifera]|eukprot:KAG9391856.1 Protein kinase domain [Carpediemonas membranifera]
MIRDATTRVFAPEDKLHLVPIGASPLTFDDLAHVVDHLSTLAELPCEFSMRLTEPNLTVTMTQGLFSATAHHGLVDSLLDAWNSVPRCLKVLHGHSDAVTGMDIMPDGTVVSRLDSANNPVVLSLPDGSHKCLSHGCNVSSFAVSWDGMIVATAGTDRAIKLWDAESGHLVDTIRRVGSRIIGMAFTRNEKLILASSSKLWVIHHVMGAREVQEPLVIATNNECARSIALSPNDTTVAIGYHDKALKIWDIRSGRLEHTLVGHGKEISCVVFSNDGSLLASGSRDCDIRVWDCNTWVCLSTLRGHTKAVFAVGFSPDDSTLASSSEDKNVKLWSVGNGACTATIEGHTSSVRCLAFTDGALPYTATLISGSDDNTAKQWSLGRSPELTALDQTLAQPVPAAAIVRLEGTVADLTRVLDRLVVQDDLPSAFTMRLTDTNATVRLRFGALVTNEHSNELDAILATWAKARRDCIASIHAHTNNVTGVVMLPDNRMVTGSTDRTLTVWTPSCEVERTMTHDGQVFCLAASSDGSTIASGGEGPVRLWNSNTGQSLSSHTELGKPLELSGHTGAVTCLAFSYDNNTLVTGSTDKKAMVWDIQWTGKCKLTLSRHADSVRAVAISPDSSVVVTGSGDKDKAIRVWDAKTGNLQHTLRGAFGVHCLSFSSDGNLLASSAGDTVILWNTEDWQPRATLSGHRKTVRCLSIAPDGDTAVSGSNDGAIKVWSTRSGECLKTLVGHALSVRCLAFGTHGSTLLSGSNDKTAKQWHIKHSPEIKEVCAQPTLAADIRLPSDDSPLYLADLARVVIHILATGLPRSFEMRMAHPECTVRMNNNRFGCVPASAEVQPLLNALNHQRLSNEVSRICAGDISGDVEIRVTHADLPALKKLLAHVEASRVAPRSFEVQLDDPAATVTLGPTGFEVAPPSDVVDYVVSGFSFLTAHLDAISTDNEISLGEHAPLTIGDLNVALAILTERKVAPRSFEMRLADPATTVTLGPTGFEVAPPSDVVDYVVSGFSFLTAHLDAISTDNEISLGEHAPLTIGDLKTVAGLLLQRETLPTSFAMRLTRPECTISYDRNGFQSSPEKAEVQTALNPLNRAQLSRRLSEICAEPITEETDLCVTHADLPSLTKLLEHLESSSVAPRSFSVQLDAPRATVRMDSHHMMVGPEIVEIKKILLKYNKLQEAKRIHLFCAREVGADVQLSVAFLSHLELALTHVASSTSMPSAVAVEFRPTSSTVTMKGGLFVTDRHSSKVCEVLARANSTIYHTMKSEIASLRAELRLKQAIEVNLMLKDHPLLSFSVPVHDNTAVPSPEVLSGRLGSARRLPETRTADYSLIIAQAEAGVALLEKRVAEDAETAAALLARVAEMENPVLPSLEDMRTLLAEVPKQKVGTDRFANLRAFLHPSVRQAWSWASQRSKTADFTPPDQLKILQLRGLVAGANSHLSGFAKADSIARDFHDLGDYQQLRQNAQWLQEDIARNNSRREIALAAANEEKLEAVQIQLEAMETALARRTPQLVRLCPELKELTAPSASLFAELREMGLAHLMDLPEMLVDLSMSDFAVESTVSENRALCQIVTRDGQTYFGKTFKLDNEHQRKLCDREAGILSRMAHSPAVPKLHFVLINLAEQTCSVVMERLENHLRDAPADSPDTQRRLLHGLLTAIHDLHSAGICHRDLKPENVMLREGHPVLVDFETASNMDAVNMTATGVNIGTLAFSAPEEIAARNSGKKLSHREQQAADVYHAGLTMLGAMAPDYPAFCQQLLALLMGTLKEFSTVNEDKLCDALLATVAVPQALREVLCGMLATHLEARWSVRRALADGLFAASANELDPEVDLNAASSRFAMAHAFVDAIDRTRLKMFAEDPLDLTLDDNLSNTLTNIGACEEDLLAVPATLSGKESAKALPDLVVKLPQTSIAQSIGTMRFSVPVFRVTEGTLVFMPDALDYPIDDLRPVLLGLGRVLQLMLLDGIRLPADMVSNTWLVALAGGRIDLAALMPLVDRALNTSIEEARAKCPLDGFEGDLNAYRSEVLSRFTDRIQLIRNGMTARTQFSEMIAALTAAQLRALLVRPNPLTVDAVMAVLRFPADSHGVQDALRAVLEDDETRRRFAFHMFGAKLPQPGASEVRFHEEYRVYTACDGSSLIPRIEEPEVMRQLFADCVPAVEDGAAANFYVIRRDEHRFTHAEIKLLLEQREYLQNCELVTLGGGTAVDVPVNRRCPACGELASREGSLASCKISTCPFCGQQFCHKCLRRMADQAEHLRHYNRPCEIAPRQTVDLPQDLDSQRTVACPHCEYENKKVSATRRQITCQGCRRTLDVRA